MKQLIIDRSKWRTGDCSFSPTYGKTELLNERGYMCCLGFYAKQLGGLTDNSIQGIFTPEHLELDDMNDDMMLLIDGGINSHFTNVAMELNDDENLDNDEREREIKHHFKFINVKVIFEGTYN